MPAGQTAELRLRLRPAVGGPGTSAATAAAALGKDFDQVMAQRKAEADEFYAELTPATASADEALVLRQASAGMLWSKQLFYYDVARWLDGDPTQPVPPAVRKTGRNSRWRNFDGFDIISMPDKWEYPWFAAWDLAFHTVPLAHLDPAFAKYQLILICREWFQNPTGALPAYEWDFGDVNPPVHAWAALQIFAIDGARDLAFLRRVFAKLLVNFTWWVNKEDAGDTNVFEGGFLGPGQHRPDRPLPPARRATPWSSPTPPAGWAPTRWRWERSPPSCTWSGEREDRDLVLKFLEHFAGIRTALDQQGLWDDTDGLFYDRLVTPSGYSVPVKVRSMVGIIPALAAGVIDGSMLQNAMTMNKNFTRFLRKEGVGDVAKLAETPQLRGEAGAQRLLLSVARPAQLERLFAKLFDESEFLSPHGLRALSAYHRDHPYQFDAEGYQSSIDYEPAESTTSMFGGNSNWRGPIWMPVNYLVIESLERYHRFYGDDLEIEYPDRVGQAAHPGPDRRRPAGPADLAVHQGRPRAAGLLRRDREDADRPGLEGQPDLQRVLPRRQRRRDRRLPPDRLDRPDRRRDPAPPRRGPVLRRRPARPSRKGPAMTSSQTTSAAGAVPAARLASDARPGVAIPARPFPLGATPGEHLGLAGTNFAIASAVADSVTLCLFDEAGAETQIPLADNDADVWHALRARSRPGQVPTGTASTAPGTRPGACGATRPSCCSTPTPRR